MNADTEETVAFHDAVLGVMDQVLTELKAMHIVLHSLLAAAGNGATSSVEISTSARGHDIKVKAYADSPVSDASNTAMDEYLRIRAEIEQRLLNGMAREAARQAG